MIIRTSVKLPEQFKELVAMATPDIKCIEEVIVGRENDPVTLREGRTIVLSQMGGFAGYAPKSRTILINMDRVMTDMTWIRRGIRLSAAVWMSLVYGFCHELVHALQVETEPELIEYDELPAEYEREATDTGLSLMARWLANHDLPKIEEMGYLGELVLEFYNSIIHKMPDKVKEDLQLNGTNAVVKLNVLARLTNEIEIDEIERLRNRIDEGLIGQKVNGEYYLTAYEAFDCK